MDTQDTLPTKQIVISLKTQRTDIVQGIRFLILEYLTSF